MERDVWELVGWRRGRSAGRLRGWGADWTWKLGSLDSRAFLFCFSNYLF